MGSWLVGAPMLIPVISVQEFCTARLHPWAGVCMILHASVACTVDISESLCIQLMQISWSFWYNLFSTFVKKYAAVEHSHTVQIYRCKRQWHLSHNAERIIGVLCPDRVWYCDFIYVMIHWIQSCNPLSLKGRHVHLTWCKLGVSVVIIPFHV